MARKSLQLTVANLVSLFYALREDRGQLFHIAAKVVMLQYSLPATFTEPVSQSLVIHQGCQSFSKTVKVRGRYQQPIETGSDQLGNACDLGGDAWDPRCHGFHQNDGDSLRKTGDTEQVTRVIQGTDAIVVHWAFEHYRSGVLELRDLSAKRCIIRPCAHQVRPHPPSLSNKPLYRVDQLMLPLGWD